MTTDILILLAGVFIVASILVLPTSWKDYKKGASKENQEH